MLRRLLGLDKSKFADPRHHFIEEVEAVLRALPTVGEVTAAEGAFALDVTTKSGKQHRVFLDNHYTETREMAPEQRRSRLNFALAAIGMEEDELTWEAARDALLPVIRGATYGIPSPEEIPVAMRGAVAESQFIRRPFLPYLDVLAVVDQPTAMTFVTRSMLKRWNVGLDEVFAAALGRVSVLSPNVELYDKTHGNLWIVSTNDTYESSRLLIPSWLASFRDKVEGNPVAIVPERGMVMVGGDARPEMIERLAVTAEKEFMASGRGISCGLYTVDEEHVVVPYRPAPDSPLSTDVCIAHEKLAKFEYDQQKRLLDALPGHTDEVFVATYMVFKLTNDAVRSTSSWTRGVPTFLPRTERVALVTLNREETAAETTTSVPFEAVAERLNLVPDLHPPRFRTGAFPDENELRALAARFAPARG